MSFVRFLIVPVLCMLLNYPAAAQYSDFSKSAVYIPESAGPGLKRAVQVFRQVIEERSNLQIPVVHRISFERENSPVIIVITEQQVHLLPDNYKSRLNHLPLTGKDGYKIIFLKDANKVIIAAHDQRGALYGVGYLLRKSQLRAGQVLVPEKLNLSSTPAYPIRGHQLGYRPKTNAYDAWPV